VGTLGAGDGVTVPGGNFANILALQLAIRNKFPETKYYGVQNISRTVAVFISEDADGGFEAKIGALEGLPKDAIVKVKTDQNGRMDPVDLEAKMNKANESGVLPLMVVATVGTPTFGAIDPIAEIAYSTEKYGAWFHVDGMRAGPLLISTKFRSRLAGIVRSDSFTWSASFMLGIPHTSSFLVTKEAGILEKTFSYGAKYVFATTQLYNHTFDVGDKTVQTSRRPDVFKTWFTWKALVRK
jgi:glutamate/tyrosine decarboxylase-like PLP-dependent enzyme